MVNPWWDPHNFLAARPDHKTWRTLVAPWWNLRGTLVNLAGHCWNLGKTFCGTFWQPKTERLKKLETPNPSGLVEWSNLGRTFCLENLGGTLVGLWWNLGGTLVHGPTLLQPWRNFGGTFRGTFWQPKAPKNHRHHVWTFRGAQDGAVPKTRDATKLGKVWRKFGGWTLPEPWSNFLRNLSWQPAQSLVETAATLPKPWWNLSGNLLTGSAPKKNHTVVEAWSNLGGTLPVVELDWTFCGNGPGAENQKHHEAWWL